MKYLLQLATVKTLKLDNVYHFAYICLFDVGSM